MPQNRMSFTLEGAQLIWLNFSGKEGPYNRAGDRHFSVLLSEEMAKALEKDGWNVKWPKPGDPEEEDTRSPHLQVAVRFDNRPPRVVMITSTGRVQLSDETVGVLDWADIRNVDIVVVASHWEVNGKSGEKAYLKTMYIEIEEDELEKKYGMAGDYATADREG